jgi:hypothetical protein
MSKKKLITVYIYTNLSQPFSKYVYVGVDKIYRDQESLYIKAGKRLSSHNIKHIKEVRVKKLKGGIQ